VWGDQAPTTHSIFAPHQTGFDPLFRSEMGVYSPARAKALLDTYGYVDRDGDGWRELPDGGPLTLERTSSTGQVYRRVDEGFERDMTAGLRAISYRSSANWSAARPVDDVGRSAVCRTASSS
jgi:ABC-type transport system substrate-binding protein